jgi:hypothetical protein
MPEISLARSREGSVTLALEAVRAGAEIEPPVGFPPLVVGVAALLPVPLPGFCVEAPPFLEPLMPLL